MLTSGEEEGKPVAAVRRKNFKKKLHLNSQTTNFQVKSARKALREFVESSDSKLDWDPTYWRAKRGRTESDIFNFYLSRMSTAFQNHGANLNFVSVGACDGTADKAIDMFLLPNNSHWHGVFVEPMSNNVRDLHKRLEKFNVTDRSTVIRAAATRHCTEDTLRVQRPLYEETKPETPHWLRRQIGGVVTKDAPPKAHWVFEDVQCVTGYDILSLWSTMINTHSDSAHLSEEVASVTVVGKKRLGCV